MILKASGIVKSFGELSILRGLNMSVDNAEIVSIVGSSGAGKTTLLQILGTLDNPDNGILEIDGINPFQLSAKKISHFRPIISQNRDLQKIAYSACRLMSKLFAW